MSVNSNTAGFLRGQIVFSDRTITKDFLKFLQAVDTRTSELFPFTVARLPLLPTPVSGTIAYATNGRKQGEGVGAGTGVPVYFSAGFWRRYSDDTPVQA
jgi:hypothetical protein